MELKSFKKIIDNFFIAKGFSKNGSYYSLFLQDIIIVIGLQRSGYSNGYYINLGYIIVKLNPAFLAPRDTDGDVRTRFSIEFGVKEKDFFDLDQLFDENMLHSYLEKNVKHYVEKITSLDSLRILLSENPIMLYQTKLSAKRLLGFA